MIIRCVTLQPFAGVLNRGCTFGPGLNVVLGPNEAGKSSLFHAILCALFIDTKLNKRDFENEMLRFIPVGGNFAQVVIEFKVGATCYTLEKVWGLNTRSVKLFREGQGILAEDDAVRNALASLLPAKEGAFRSTLMAYQSGLIHTLKDLATSHSETLNELGDILRQTIMNTGGISIDTFRQRLAGRLQASLGRWDLAMGRPEDGKGIENRWKKGVGSVLESYYKMEEARAAYDRAKRFEDDLDRLNSSLTEVSKELGLLHDYVVKNEKIVADARERRTLQAEIGNCEREIEQLRSVSKRWPVCESEIQKLAETLPSLTEQLERLREEEQAAKRHENLRTVRETIERAKEPKAAHDAAMEKLKSAKVITNAELKKVEEYERRINGLKLTLGASKLSVVITPKKKLEYEFRDGVNPSHHEVAGAGEQKEYSASGRVRLAHVDWTIEVKSGEGTFDADESSLMKYQQDLTEFLKQHGLSTVEEARTVHEDYRRAVSEEESARKVLENVLNGQELATLIATVQAGGPMEITRPLADVSKELATIYAEVRQQRNRHQELEREFGGFVSKYKNPDALLDTLTELNQRLKEFRKKEEKLTPLPPEVTDIENFFDEFEEAKERREKEREKKQALQLEIADLKGPDESAEALEEQYQNVRGEFERNLRAGHAFENVRIAAERILGNIDGNTFGSLEKQVAEYVSIMTDRRYKAIEMNGSLPAAFKQPHGQSIPVSYLSAGTKDVLGLAIRLAMAKHFLGSADGFIAMDDPLVDLDPDRQKRAAELLKEFAKEKQVIIHTCHPGHAELLNENPILMDRHVL